MMVSRNVMDGLKAKHSAEGRLGPASDLFHLPDDLLMEEYDAALLGYHNSYSLKDCTKEAVRRGLVEKPKQAGRADRQGGGQFLNVLKNWPSLWAEEPASERHGV